MKKSKVIIFDFIDNELIAHIKSTESQTAKAILEKTFLDNNVIVHIYHIANEVGIDFVKSQKRFNWNQAILLSIHLMKQRVFNKTQVKAVGRINNLNKLIQMLKADATWIATSAGPVIVEIVDESNKNEIKLNTMLKTRKENVLWNIKGIALPIC